MDTKFSTIKRAVLKRDALPGVTTFNIGASPVGDTLSRVTTFKIDMDLIDAFEASSETGTQIKHLSTHNAACKRQCLTCVHFKKSCPLSNPINAA